MANVIKFSPGYYPSPIIGRPLSLAQIYVGEPDTDPEIVGNQKQVSALQEDTTTVQIPQPVRTNAGGVPVYNGSPVTLLVDGSYSLKVLSALGVQRYYIPSSAESSSDSIVVDTIADLRLQTGGFENQIVSVSGYYTVGDGGGGPDRYWSQGQPAGTYIDNGGSIIVQTGGDGSAAWLWGWSGSVNPMWYGAKFDNVTVDTSFLQNIFNIESDIKFPDNNLTTLTGNLTINSNMTIDLNGCTLNRDESTAPGSTSTPTFATSDGSLLSTDNAISNFTIKNGSIKNYHSTTATYSQGGIYLGNTVSSVKVINIKFLDTANGVTQTDIVAGEPSYELEDLEVCGCTLIGEEQPVTPWSVMIYSGLLVLTSNNASNVIIDGNRIEKAQSLCLINQSGSIALSNNIIVKNNIVKNMYSNGIYLYASKSIVTNNRVSDTGTDGIKILSLISIDQEYNIVSNNIVEGTNSKGLTGSACLRMDGNNFNLSNNVLIAYKSGSPTTAQDCIRYGGDFFNITGNTLQGYVGGTSVGVQSAAQLDGTHGNHIVISGNTFDELLIGINGTPTSLESGSYVTITGNNFNVIGSAINFNALSSSGTTALPIFHSVANNVFHGSYSASTSSLVQYRRCTKVNLSNNSFSGYRSIDIDGDSNGITGAGNITDGMSDTKNATSTGPLFTTDPAIGTWGYGDMITVNTDLKRCTVAGTSGSPTSPITINTTSGVLTATVSDATDLFGAMYVDAVGVTETLLIRSISGTTVTFVTAPTATVSGAALTYSSPTWVIV